MHAADPDAAVRGKQFQLVARSDLARNQRTGDHRAETLHYERPVDRQAKISAAILFGRGNRYTRQLRPQLLEACAGFCANGNYWSTVEERFSQEFGNFQAYQLKGMAIDQIGLREGHDPPRNGQQPADIKMFAGLRLDGLVRCNHQQNDIEATRPCKHVTYEAFMSRNIDEAEPHVPYVEERKA